MKELVAKAWTLKTFLPIISIGVLFGIWSLVSVQGKAITPDWIGAVLFVVILVAGFLVNPYEQFCSDANYNSFGNSNPFGIDGWIISLIHWFLVLLIYVYTTRKLSLGKSLLCFLMLALVSLVAIYLIFLSALKYELCISGC